MDQYQNLSHKERDCKLCPAEHEKQDNTAHTKSTASFKNRYLIRPKGWLAKCV